MKLKSLKLSKKEASEDTMAPMSATKPRDEDLPKYPYGTRLRLENDALEKLDIDVSEYSTGDILRIEAIVEVCGTSQVERQGGKQRDELELQITEMGLEPDKKAKKAKASSAHLGNISRATSDSAEADA